MHLPPPIELAPPRSRSIFPKEKLWFSVGEKRKETNNKNKRT
jgi:hypothetical protein